MIRPDQIPDEVVKAARAEYMSGTGSLDEDLRCAIAAALAAWSGADFGTKIVPDEKTGEWHIPVRVLRLPMPPEGGEG